jgi:hypothetical protein
MEGGVATVDGHCGKKDKLYYDEARGEWEARTREERKSITRIGTFPTRGQPQELVARLIRKAHMTELRFQGTVNRGIGRFSDMTIPGRAGVTDPPRDWPDAMYPGSLNVLIADDGWPAELMTRCTGEWIQRLDCGDFVPAFTIPQSAITNNRLRPTIKNPRRGDAQVWRARIENAENSMSADCWLLRRIGSGLTRQIELVASERLREKIALADGAYVSVTVQGQWRAT